MLTKFKLILVITSLLSLGACGKGDTSVDTREVSTGNVPATFVGTYRGTISAEAKKGFLKSSSTDPITIIVRSNNTILFQGDDPGESFVTAIGANGNFNGVLPIKTSDCSGDINVSGSVNGVIASGELGGVGDCSGIGSVGVSGNFTATK